MIENLLIFADKDSLLDQMLAMFLTFLIHLDLLGLEQTQAVKMAQWAC